MFTFHLEPQVIRVHAPGIRVIQENCMHCHEHLLHDTRLSVATGKNGAARGGQALLGLPP